MKLVSKCEYGSFRLKLVPQIKTSSILLEFSEGYVLIKRNSLVTARFLDMLASLSVTKYPFYLKVTKL